MSTEDTPVGVGEAVPGNPPRENLVRAVGESIEIRDAEDGAMPSMRLRYVPFNEWTEIRSAWEGNFMERVSPGATLKTISESRDRLKIQFDHGKDPSIGGKLLGTLSDIREEEDGGWADVDLFDTSYNRDLLPGLKAGAYGASFRFKVMREDFTKRPGESEHNPSGLPERTIHEMRLEELGPVTWPAYAGTKVGVRSATDEFIMAHLFADPERLRAFIEARFAPSTQTPPIEAPLPERREETGQKRTMTNEEWYRWIHRT